ncbi:MAG: site-specific integrase [Hydrogenophaga sp.]|nr:site-specific integrase [Hydrogenophaga sp.]
MASKNSVIALDVRQQFRTAHLEVLSKVAVDDVQHMDQNSLLHIQAMLGHGSTWGVWETPRSWFPGGFKAGWNARVRDRIVDLLRKEVLGTEACLDSQPKLSRLLDGAVLSCTRYLVLCRIGPVSLSNLRDSLDPSVIAQMGYSHLPILASVSIEKAFRSIITIDDQLQGSVVDGNCFDRLEFTDIDALDYSVSVKQTMKGELKRMHAAYTRGIWTDSPDIGIDITQVTSVSGDKQDFEREAKASPHLPLPDDFVGEIGQKSNWLILNLGPNLLCILKEFLRIWEKSAQLELGTRYVSEICQKYLAGYSWIDANGQALEALPFELRLSRRGAHSKKLSKLKSMKRLIEEESLEGGGDPSEIDISWPPRGAAQIFGLARLLQGAHLFVIGLSTGARNGETLMMERSCVHRAPDGVPYANGRTYKLVRLHEGEVRDWPLPELAERTFDQQEKLISLVERLSPLGQQGAVANPRTISRGTGLWFMANDRAAEITSASLLAVLRNYVAYLGMEVSPGGQGIRPHRLRKTLARMVALSIVQAPKVLQDVFGHKDIEMTLYYILADKSLAAEIDVIVRELRVMRCSDVIASMVLAEEERPRAGPQRVGKGSAEELCVVSGFGGRAAASVGRAVEEYGRELHRTSQEWGAESVGELAKILSFGGATWDLVRPGVLCTKSLGQFGPCNKKRGHPDPGNCQTSCDYRLEEAWLREDVERCLSDSIEHWERETEVGQDLIAEFWAGQVRMHVNRFSDLKTKWMQDPRVSAIVEPHGAKVANQ